MVKALSWVFVLFFCLVALAPGQTTSREISKKERELKKLRADIQAYEQKLKESEKREQVTLEDLDDLDRQSNLIRQLIRSLQDEERRTTEEIHAARLAIAELEAQQHALMNHYANYIRSVYKNGRIYDVELLFSSRSLNQLSIRIQYLRRFSDQRAKDLRRLIDTRTELELRNEQLQINLANERQLIAEKTREEAILKNKMLERQRMLANIRKNKRAYEQSLRRKVEAAQQVENLIAELIEKERIRKEKEEAERKERERLAAAREAERLARLPRPTPPEPLSAFEQQRGNLPWPVANGRISSRFGNQVHPELRTVTHNPGIEITVPPGSDVFAVADGEVSVLSFIPGFGNVMIVNHYHGYRTVYGHLADINVVEGQKVRAGEVIAKSGDSVSGNVLHFEIWKEREKQNPEAWLARVR
jgi:septal ring factor EnvC (AmiA/AmiB activator)